MANNMRPKLKRLSFGRAGGGFGKEVNHFWNTFAKCFGHEISGVEREREREQQRQEEEQEPKQKQEQEGQEQEEQQLSLRQRFPIAVFYNIVL